MFYTYQCLLSNCALIAAPRAKKVLQARPFDSFLFPNPASHHSLTINVKNWNKLGESVCDTALSKSLSIASKLDAWAEEGEKTYKLKIEYQNIQLHYLHVVQSPKQPKIPLLHSLDIVAI